MFSLVRVPMNFILNESARARCSYCLHISTGNRLTQLLIMLYIMAKRLHLSLNWLNLAIPIASLFQNGIWKSLEKLMTIERVTEKKVNKK